MCISRLLAAHPFSFFRARDRFYSRWIKAEKVLAVPWAERVSRLKKYKPFPGYDPHG